MLTSFVAPCVAVALAASAVGPPKVANAPAQHTGSIEVREVFWADRHGGLRHESLPFLGQRVLEGEELYTALGRPDLARQMRHSAETKTLLTVAAYTALLATGVAGFIAAGPSQACLESGRSCDGGHEAVMPILALGLAGALTLGIGAHTMTIDPLTASQRQALIDEHNRRLEATSAAP